MSALRKLFMSELFTVKFEYTKHAINRKRLFGNYRILGVGLCTAKINGF